MTPSPCPPPAGDPVTTLSPCLGRHDPISMSPTFPVTPSPCPPTCLGTPSPPSPPSLAPCHHAALCPAFHILALKQPTCTSLCSRCSTDAVCPSSSGQSICGLRTCLPFWGPVSIRFQCPSTLLPWKCAAAPGKPKHPRRRPLGARRSRVWPAQPTHH